MTNRQPCTKKGAHRHAVSWDGRGGLVKDRCRSLYLWSTLAYHVVAGDDPRLDGVAFTDKAWAMSYLHELKKNPLTRNTAVRLFRALERKGITT